MESNLKEKYRALFTSAMGKEVLEDLLENCGVERSPFHPDPHTHAYQSGKQSVGFYLINKLKETANGKRTDISTGGGDTGNDPTRTDPERVPTDPTSRRFIP